MESHDVDLGTWQERVAVGRQLSGTILMSETSLGRGAPGGVPVAEMERRKTCDERGAAAAAAAKQVSA